MGIGPSCPRRPTDREVPENRSPLSFSQGVVQWYSRVEGIRTDLWNRPNEGRSLQTRKSFSGKQQKRPPDNVPM